jgi:Fur family transcriptional regulator, peroxide stress response regulator
MMRKSKQKEAIIRIVKSTSAHPDAEWIYEEVRKEIPNISLGTVYRNLRLLHEGGIIQEVCQSGGMSHFDGNVKAHYHFRCDRCGKIFDLDETVDRRLENKVAQKTGFKVTHHDLELGGFCLSCQGSKGRS